MRFNGHLRATVGGRSAVDARPPVQRSHEQDLVINTEIVDIPMSVENMFM